MSELLPIGLPALRHCDQPMTWKGTRTGWEGDDEIVAARFLCAACGLRVSIETRVDVGPPAADSPPVSRAPI